MKISIIIITCFILGLVLGIYQDIPKFFLENNIELYILYILIFLVGASVTAEKNLIRLIKKTSLKHLALPLVTITGTYLGMFAFSLVPSGLNLKELLAIGSGMGYYSISSVLIAELKNEYLGTIALLANISRELLTLLLAPVLYRVFGKFAPITSAGATSMDTTLPIISRTSGKDSIIIAIIHGAILTILVPILVTFFCNL